MRHTLAWVGLMALSAFCFAGAYLSLVAHADSLAERELQQARQPVKPPLESQSIRLVSSGTHYVGGDE